jgi:hypothetical protein
VKTTPNQRKEPSFFATAYTAAENREGEGLAIDENDFTAQR